MPSNKFFGKSKADLVMLAVLGRVLSAQEAEQMSQEELSAFLFIKDLESSDISKEQSLVKNKKTIQSKENNPLIKKQVNERASKTSAKVNNSISDTSSENLQPKLSKKELNKQKFMMEMGMLENDKTKENATNSDVSNKTTSNDTAVSKTANDSKLVITKDDKSGKTSGIKPLEKTEEITPSINEISVSGKESKAKKRPSRSVMSASSLSLDASNIESSENDNKKSSPEKEINTAKTTANQNKTTNKTNKPEAVKSKTIAGIGKSIPSTDASITGLDKSINDTDASKSKDSIVSTDKSFNIDEGKLASSEIKSMVGDKGISNSVDLTTLSTNEKATVKKQSKISQKPDSLKVSKSKTTDTKNIAPKSAESKNIESKNIESDRKDKILETQVSDSKEITSDNIQKANTEITNNDKSANDGKLPSEKLVQTKSGARKVLRTRTIEVSVDKPQTSEVPASIKTPSLSETKQVAKSFDNTKPHSISDVKHATENSERTKIPKHENHNEQSNRQFSERLDNKQHQRPHKLIKNGRRINTSKEEQSENGISEQIHARKSIAEESRKKSDKQHELGFEAKTSENLEESLANTEADTDSIAGTDNKKHEKYTNAEALETVEGVLEIMPDGYGFLRKFNYLQSPKDIYIPPQYIRRFNLRQGDWISGPGKQQRENDRYQAILYIKEVNGLPPEKMIGRPQFDNLTPIYPDERFILETTRNELSTRIIDLVAPIGKGQRGMIVSPPKAGKTILLQKIANAISINNPDTKLIVLLIDERPEEVTDMQRSINGEVVYSTFDKTPENHVKIVELVLERAMRLVELGQDVVILLDSITRLSRAYNLTINPTGRTLSGGLDPGALYGPKRFFGSARNIENGGSLTIIATSLIETGSRMDEVIFEEFKGTGNMEVYLDRKLSEKRIFPAIDLNRSGTRREELLLTKRELDAVWTIRKAFGQLDTSAVTEMIINLLMKTNNNNHFVSSVNVSLNDKAMFDAMRGTKPGGGAGNSQGGSYSSNNNNYNNNNNNNNNNN